MEKHSSGFASKMLHKMGFRGKGLGKSENGIREPIKVERKDRFNAEAASKQKRDANRKLTVILSDSMLNQLDEKRLSNKYHEVKVKCHSGCTTNCMYTHIPSVIALKPDYVLLNIGTNDCTNIISDEILKRIQKLKQYIEKKLPSCIVYISLPTERSDNQIANAIVRNLNRKLKKTDLLLLENSNITARHIGRKGLHFNDNGTKEMASNIISLIKRL